MTKRGPGVVDDDELISLVALADVLRGYGVTPTYRRLYLAAVHGDIPARRIDGRWRVAQSDVPGIASALRVPSVA